ncbi:hypothetical protein DL89DRAFT_263931 [Linderina pennispora]|uniref:Uncharacterized protein n=1 Tax=Linderina pennispora TaxID=61395 RepID=A0A1Y1WL32_9FUNG|nr:uncharacterized protein DL89DRAFT_263931 [Linderina pennispora]ORX73916.1 hypothetical protein DL89DRAFT_263931 [Linderina pennispora]
MSCRTRILCKSPWQATITRRNHARGDGKHTLAAKQQRMSSLCLLSMHLVTWPKYSCALYAQWSRHTDAIYRPFKQGSGYIIACRPVCADRQDKGQQGRLASLWIYCGLESLDDFARRSGQTYARLLFGMFVEWRNANRRRGSPLCMPTRVVMSLAQETKVSAQLQLKPCVLSPSRCMRLHDP